MRKHLGVVAHACNSRRLKQEDHEFEVSLSYTVRFCLQTTKQNKKTKRQEPTDHQDE